MLTLSPTLVGIACISSVTSEAERYYDDDTHSADGEEGVNVQEHLELDSAKVEDKVLSFSANLRATSSVRPPVPASASTVDINASAHDEEPLGEDEALSVQSVVESLTSLTYQRPHESSSLISPASAAYSRTDTIPIKADMDPMTEKCIAQYGQDAMLQYMILTVILRRISTTSSNDLLYSITMDLNGGHHGGSAAFLLAIIMYAPNEETLQIGGYQNYITSQRLWNR